MTEAEVAPWYHAQIAADRVRAALEAMKAQPPMPVPGPDRQQLLALVV